MKNLFTTIGEEQPCSFFILVIPKKLVTYFNKS
jgi:hypothetical protein